MTIKRWRVHTHSLGGCVGRWDRWLDSTFNVDINTDTKPSCVRWVEEELFVNEESLGKFKFKQLWMHVIAGTDDLYCYDNVVSMARTLYIILCRLIKEYYVSSRVNLPLLHPGRPWKLYLFRTNSHLSALVTFVSITSPITRKLLATTRITAIWTYTNHNSETWTLPLANLTRLQHCYFWRQFVLLISLHEKSFTFRLN